MPIEKIIIVYWFLQKQRAVQTEQTVDATIFVFSLHACGAASVPRKDIKSIQTAGLAQVYVSELFKLWNINMATPSLGQMEYLEENICRFGIAQGAQAHTSSKMPWNIIYFSVTLQISTNV